MQDIIMDRFTEKEGQICERRTEAVAHYPALWSKMIAEWNSPGPEDRIWLMYSANYLFRTNNVRWAIDPLTIGARIKAAPRVNVTCDLSNLSFVLLTHSHKDHLDIDLVSALRHLPIKWVVPKWMLSSLMKEAGLLRENIIVPVPLKAIELDGIRIIPFNGLHREITSDQTSKTVPALAYLIACNNKRWLFPGDTRTYDAAQLLDFGFVDHLFAHLWLGHSSALMEEPPLTDAFCRFCLDLKPAESH
jgi:L-ascorbate metabolism protein UlaG (beta-lactamase superfamily)